MINTQSQADSNAGSQVCHVNQCRLKPCNSRNMLSAKHVAHPEQISENTPAKRRGYWTKVHQGMRIFAKNWLL